MPTLTVNNYADQRQSNLRVAKAINADYAHFKQQGYRIRIPIQALEFGMHQLTINKITQGRGKIAFELIDHWASIIFYKVAE